MSLRTTFETNENDNMLHASLGIGGRYFFGSGDISPFAGAGIAISMLEIQHRAPRDGYYRDASGSGFGAFAEGGVELLRLHGTRLILGLRVDAPFYVLESSPSYDYLAANGTTTVSQEPDEYHLPITLSATYAW